MFDNPSRSSSADNGLGLVDLLVLLGLVDLLVLLVFSRLIGTSGV